MTRLETNLSQQYDEIITQIGTVVADSNYKGTNLLGNSESLTVTFDESGDSQLTVAGIDGSGGLTAWYQQVPGAAVGFHYVTADIAFLDDARN